MAYTHLASAGQEARNLPLSLHAYARGLAARLTPVFHVRIFALRDLAVKTKKKKKDKKPKEGKGETLLSDETNGHSNGHPTEIHHGDLKANAHEISGKVFMKELARLQIELVKLQEWVKHEGLKIVVLFEGRDAAGKGGVIKRITESLNPRICRVVALGRPTERERTSWYFQRYVEHLPSAGEIVLFDRSWYNRAGVEHVMGFCTDKEYQEFLQELSRIRNDVDPLRNHSGQILVLGQRSRSRRSASRAGCSIRRAAGSSARWTWNRVPSGTNTPRPRTPCSPTPTPSSHPGAS